jgi:restriction endonuclease S subunit
MGHQTTGIQNLNIKEYLSREIKLPTVDIQKEFVAIAEKAESAKTALKKSIADIDQVMKGLING